VTPTGTVTYTFYSGGDDCVSGTASPAQNVTINANGTVPPSSNHGPLTAAGGPYAFKVQYPGDGNFVAGTDECEPFDVSKGAGKLATTVYDFTTQKPLANPVPANVTVFDTATLTPETPGVTPTGSVTYTFYSGGDDCVSGTASPAQQVTINPDGTVPPSSNQGPLTAAGGPYAFKVQYPGDGNFVAGTDECEPFAIGKDESSLSTTVYDFTTQEPIASPVAL
jgi:hypothetical protein